MRVIDLRSSRRRCHAENVQASDAELIRSAARGDAAALGAVLHRHRPALLATAVALIGRDEAEDVVHDAFLVAMRHVGELRDPSAAGAWLRAIVRTQALMRLRGRRERPMADIDALAGVGGGPGPEEAIEALALRAWVWSALERLSEPLRVVALPAQRVLPDPPTGQRQCEMSAGRPRGQRVPVRMPQNGGDDVLGFPPEGKDL